MHKSKPLISFYLVLYEAMESWRASEELQPNETDAASDRKDAAKRNIETCSHFYAPQSATAEGRIRGVYSWYDNNAVEVEIVCRRP